MQGPDGVRRAAMGLYGRPSSAPLVPLWGWYLGRGRCRRPKNVASALTHMATFDNRPMSPGCAAGQINRQPRRGLLSHLAGALEDCAPGGAPSPETSRRPPTWPDRQRRTCVEAVRREALLLLTPFGLWPRGVGGDLRSITSLRPLRTGSLGPALQGL